MARKIQNVKKSRGKIHKTRNFVEKDSKNKNKIKFEMQKKKQKKLKMVRNFQKKLIHKLLYIFRKIPMQKCKKKFKMLRDCKKKITIGKKFKISRHLWKNSKTLKITNSQKLLEKI